MRTPLALLTLSTVLFLAAGSAQVKSSTVETSTLETWKATEEAAAKASKLAHFAEAEKLLLANQKLAETFSPKDARLPLTLFDLAQIY